MMKNRWREALSEDWEVNKGNPKGRFLLLHFRIASAIQHSSRFCRAVGSPFLVYYKLFIEWILGFELPSSTKVGAGLQVHHGSGVVINPKVTFGRRCALLHQVTVGTLHDGPEAGTPVVGDDVIIGVGAKVLGPITIGSGARIGAGALVLKDVSEGQVVVGNPMRILKEAPREKIAE